MERLIAEASKRELTEFEIRDLAVAFRNSR